MPYGRLEQFTELVVSPKSRDGIGNQSSFPVRTSEKAHFHRKQDMDCSSHSGPSFEAIPPSQRWGGIGDLWSLLRHIIQGTNDPVKELPPIPNIPAIFTDSLYRVCGTPPGSLSAISQNASGVIHLFPLSHRSKFVLTGGQPSVSYGLLTRVLSPKEARNRAKQAREKNKNTEVTEAAATVNDGKETKNEEVMVARVVCHVADRCQDKGDIHSGTVWVSVLLVYPSCLLLYMLSYLFFKHTIFRSPRLWPSGGISFLILQ